MNEHKTAIHAEWNAAPLWGHTCSRTHEVIGGKLAELQLVTFLKHEIRLGKLELALKREREQGREWWATFIEEPADHELMVTLRMAVPRRFKETDGDYTHRLRLIEAAMRARLPSYIRDSYEADRESL